MFCMVEAKSDPTGMYEKLANRLIICFFNSERAELPLMALSLLSCRFLARSKISNKAEELIFWKAELSVCSSWSMNLSKSCRNESEFFHNFDQNVKDEREGKSEIILCWQAIQEWLLEEYVAAFRWSSWIEIWRLKFFYMLDASKLDYPALVVSHAKQTFCYKFVVKHWA